MARVAFVTGGTRGIGEAVCLALKDQGFTVVANYGGDEAKARSFTAANGIPAYKWDVGDHQACLDSCADRGGDRADRRAGQQCRHHPRRRAPQDELR